MGKMLLQCIFEYQKQNYQTNVAHEDVNNSICCWWPRVWLEKVYSLNGSLVAHVLEKKIQKILLTGTAQTLERALSI